MKKKLLSLALTLCLILSLLPVTASAASTRTIGASGYFPLTETGLRDAIAASVDGDTIQFLDSGTITLTSDMNVNKSITLDLNGKTIDFSYVDPDRYHLYTRGGASVTIQGPGTIRIKSNIRIDPGTTLTVQGGAELEAYGSWYTLDNTGTLFMTGGALRQTNGFAALLNQVSGTAIFSNVTIENNSAIQSTVYSYGGATFNNCTIRNKYTGAGTWPASAITVYNTGSVNLINGSVIGPTGSPAVYADSSATFTNTGSIVKLLGDLSVSVSSGIGKVTLAPQATEAGVTYYYKTSATDDSGAKPAYDSAVFDTTGWTSYSTTTDIPAAGTSAVYVQVVKVGPDGKVYGWGQGSATPMAASAPSNWTYIAPVDAVLGSPSADFDIQSPQDVAVALQANGNTLLFIRNGATPLVSGLDYTYSGGIVTIKKEYLAKQASDTITLTLDMSAGADPNFIITLSDVESESIPQTGDFDHSLMLTAMLLTLTLCGIVSVTIRKRKI